MLRTVSAHTWLSTIAAVIAIIGWLTGLQTIYEIGALSLSRWNSAQGAIAIAILIVSIAVVFGAFYVIATIIFVKVLQNGALRSPTKTIFMFMSFAIGFILHDTFFGLDELLNGSLLSIFVAPVLIFLAPYSVNESAYSNANEWGCGNCGRFTLVNVDRRDTRTRETRKYLTDENDRHFLRIERWQDYEVERECPHCGNTWFWSKSYSLGHHDYPSDQ